jgi:hypothetical protein
MVSESKCSPEAHASPTVSHGSLLGGNTHASMAPTTRKGVGSLLWKQQKGEDGVYEMHDPKTAAELPEDGEKHGDPAGGGRESERPAELQG